MKDPRVEVLSDGVGQVHVFNVELRPIGPELAGGGCAWQLHVMCALCGDDVLVVLVDPARADVGAWMAAHYDDCPRSS